MKRLFFTLILVIFILTSFGQIKEDSSTIKNERQELLLNLDTLKIQNIKSIESSKPWYENNNMPWIISLIISCLTIAINIYIANVNQRTAIKNVLAQIKSSTETSQKQLESSKQIAIQQIENSQGLALTQFKSTLNTKNRQDWINELRHCISEFLAQSAVINIIMASNDDANKGQELQPFFEKMVYHKNKIAMLLNVEKIEQRNVIDSVYKMTIISIQPEKDYNAKKFREIEEEILKASRILFGIHWTKIKNI